MGQRVLRNPLNGRHTLLVQSYDGALSQKSQSNTWSSTENSANNAWNVNFNDGNTNNNNKYNANVVRAVAAYGELFGIFYDTVVEAYEDCLKNKHSSPHAIEYMKIAHEDLVNLAVELWTGTYMPSTSTCFVVKYPKFREVFAADFRDRIVHHWVCLRLEPLFEEKFVAQGNVSYNCRKGYGTQKAVENATQGIERVSDHYHKDATIFKGDLVGFFMSIDKALLWYLLDRFIQRKYKGRYRHILSETVRKIVMHHPERNCVLNSDPEVWLNLAPNKSLFRCDEGKGEPIGNLTTQLFANFLMSFFDQYVMWVFRRKNYTYTRFVDDFVIVCDDKQFLLQSIDLLDKFLDEKMHLKLHKDKRYIQPARHGVMFVGSYIMPGREYLSNRVLARFEERVHGFSELMMQRPLNSMDCERIQSVINSYLGFCKGKRTYKRRKRILLLFPRVFYEYFYIDGHFERIKTKNKYKSYKIA